MASSSASVNILDDRINSLQNELRSQTRRLRRRTVLSQTIWQTTCCIFAIMHPNVVPALVFFRRKIEDAADTDAELAGRLQHWWAQNYQADTLRVVLEPVSNQGKLQKKTALSFLKDWELHEWIEKNNVDKGIAPCSAVVLREFRVPAVESEPSASLAGAAKHKHRLQWLRRFRRRWSIELGDFAAREALPPEAARRKVLGDTNHASGNMTPTEKLVRHSIPRPQNECRNPDLILSPRIHSVYCVEPKSGPKIEPESGMDWYPRQQLSGAGRIVCTRTWMQL